MTVNRLTIRPTIAAGAVIALVATLGSLYASESLGLYPCELCWYQRIFMYPLVIILGIATFDRHTRIYHIALALTLSGAGIAAYHSWLQLAATGECAIGTDCTAIQYQVLGFFTLPNLAFIAFSLISFIVLTTARLD